MFAGVIERGHDLSSRSWLLRLSTAFMPNPMEYQSRSHSSNISGKNDFVDETSTPSETPTTTSGEELSKTN